jgi:hypothetical protein
MIFSDIDRWNEISHTVYTAKGVTMFKKILGGIIFERLD